MITFPSNTLLNDFLLHDKCFCSVISMMLCGQMQNQWNLNEVCA
jgi:hypothetical protein